MKDRGYETRSARSYEERVMLLEHRHDRDMVIAALGVLGDNDAGDVAPEDLVWRYVPDLPVETLLGCLCGDDVDVGSWHEWFADELIVDRDEFDGGRGWSSLAHERIREPVIVTIEPGRTQIWDGWHRVGGTIVGGRDGIPAIVGMPAPDAAPSSKATRIGM